MDNSDADDRSSADGRECRCFDVDFGNVDDDDDTATFTCVNTKSETAVSATKLRHLNITNGYRTGVLGGK